MLSDPLFLNLVILEHMYSKKEYAVASNWNWILQDWIPPAQRQNYGGSYPQICIVWEHLSQDN